jgi:hypothetical protein
MVKTLTELIESLPFENVEKLELALIYLGRKPATLIDVVPANPVINYGRHKGIVRLEDGKREEIKDTFDRLGLSYNITPKRTVRYLSLNGGKSWIKHERIRVYVGRTQKDVSKLHNAASAWDEKRQGEAYGFPKTAIAAFCGKTALLHGEPVIGYFDVYAAFRTSMGFRLSQKHYKKELNEKIGGDLRALKKENFKLYLGAIKYKSRIGRQSIVEDFLNSNKSRFDPHADGLLESVDEESPVHLHFALEVMKSLGEYSYKKSEKLKAYILEQAREETRAIVRYGHRNRFVADIADDADEILKGGDCIE